MHEKKGLNDSYVLSMHGILSHLGEEGRERKGRERKEGRRKGRERKEGRRKGRERKGRERKGRERKERRRREVARGKRF